MRNVSTRLSFGGVLLMFTMTVVAQQRAAIPDAVGAYLGSDKWIGFNAASAIAVSDVWDRHGAVLGLGKDDRMVPYKTETDDLGWTHHHYQQVHKGIPVEFAVYMLHEQDGRLVKGNGEIARDVVIHTVPGLSRDEAFDFAQQCVGAVTYYWDIPRLEEMKQYATGDFTATFYPEGELLIVDEDFYPHTLPSYRLAWKFDIYAYYPHGRSWIYIDAHTGAVIKELKLDIHEHEPHAPGTAQTRYSGVQNIFTTQHPEGFVLRDPSRGRGIETYDALHDFTVENAVDFYDSDNYWNLVNDRGSDAATDAHWAAEMYYDYLLHRHGIWSYDNQGSKMICFVHVGERWRNASWSGFWSNYGDAGGDPWTHIDVVAHEFTHGFIWATCGLLYTMESGALNESFCDILGETLQHYAHGTTDWYATPAPVDTIRSYRSPNDFAHPDTYLGEHWFTGSGDNFGVHTNSGVQNYWFYLLSEGGSGTNDNGHEYEVEAIGIDNAIDIVIRNMTVYLFPTSDYHDARQASLQSAEDLFGVCSQEYRQVANAWHAVGVGERADPQDFTILGIEKTELCQVSATAPVKMTVKHLGCAHTGPVTLIFTLNKSNPLLVLRDTVELTAGLGPGEVFDYVFPVEVDFSRTGEHVLTAHVSSDVDLNKGNDTSPSVTIHNLSPVVQQRFPFHNRIALRTYRDSIAMTKGEFAKIVVQGNVGRDSTHGILIEGDRLRYAKALYDHQDPFLYNHRLATETCMCVDAQALDSVELRFDLRQTYSSDYDTHISGDQPKSSAMRVMADDKEMARYFPETHADDPWQSHTIDLTTFAGQQFVLCFETRTMVGLAFSHDSIGDRVFLDNIEISDGESPSSVSATAQSGSLVIFPNPAQDMMYIDIPSESSALGELTLRDLHGRLVATQTIPVVRGINRSSLDVSALHAGVYFLEILVAGERRIGKVVVQ